MIEPRTRRFPAQARDGLAAPTDTAVAGRPATVTAGAPADGAGLA